MRRHANEVLVGDQEILDALVTRHRTQPPNELQETVEELIETLLDDREKRVFYMRFGERMPHRHIAAELGYKSPFTIYRIIEKIIDKVRKGLDAQSHY